MDKQNSKYIYALIFVAFGLFFGSGKLYFDAKEREAKSQENSAIFEMRSKCANYAKKFNADDGWKSTDAMHSYENHFNVKLNKCFVIYKNTNIQKGYISIDSDFFDLMDNKLLGSYHGLFKNENFNDEAELKQCSVTVISGDVQKCKNINEFRRLVSFYMND